MAASLWSRKLDLLYLTFFCIHIPIMFAIDLTSLYPESLIPGFSIAIKKFYITTYQDQFFVSPPPFFLLFTWMEALFHVPVCTWLIFALRRDDAKTPLVLLLYGMQTLITTGVCIWDFLHWEGVSMETKWNLTGLYGPYIALSILMVVDTSFRITKALERQGNLGQIKKRV